VEGKNARDLQLCLTFRVLHKTGEGQTNFFAKSKY